MSKEKQSGNFLKQKNRMASMKHKFETEKLRDMLREKCRIRVRECREKNFNRSRSFLIGEKEWLTDLLKKEFTELEENLLLQDVIYRELIDESYQWLVEQYEKELIYYASTESKGQVVVCPICQLSELNLTDNLLSCTCGARFNYNGSLQDFWNKIQETVAQHENSCGLRLMFFIEPNAVGHLLLNTMCKHCDFFAAIVD